MALTDVRDADRKLPGAQDQFDANTGPRCRDNKLFWIIDLHAAPTGGCLRAPAIGGWMALVFHSKVADSEFTQRMMRFLLYRTAIFLP